VVRGREEALYYVEDVLIEHYSLALACFLSSLPNGLSIALYIPAYSNWRQKWVAGGVVVEGKGMVIEIR